MGFKKVDVAEKRPGKHRNRVKGRSPTKMEQIKALTKKVEYLKKENEDYRTSILKQDLEILERKRELHRWRKQSFVLDPEGLTLVDKKENDDTSDSEISIEVDMSQGISKIAFEEAAIASGRQFGSSTPALRGSIHSV